MMAALTVMGTQLGVPEETLAEYIRQTYQGRSYMQLASAEVTDVMKWLDEDGNFIRYTETVYSNSYHGLGVYPQPEYRVSEP